MKKRYLVAAGDMKVQSVILKPANGYTAPERMFRVKHCPKGHINIWDTDGQPPKNCWHCERRINHGR